LMPINGHRTQTGDMAQIAFLIIGLNSFVIYPFVVVVVVVVVVVLVVVYLKMGKKTSKVVCLNISLMGLMQ
jgi:Mn2+/Fe2+ NRAMP family transporter